MAAPQLNFEIPRPDVPLDQAGKSRASLAWFNFWLALRTNVLAAGGTVTHTSGALALNRLLLGNGGDDIKAVGANDGQIPIGATSDHAVSLQTLTAGPGVSIVNGPHSITLSVLASASLIPLVTGAEPPVLVSDGDGHLILVPAA